MSAAHPTPLLMRYDPATGDLKPYPSEANQWRQYHGQTAWLFNPWTGKRRDARDVGSDPFGLAIVPSYGLADPHDPFIKRAVPSGPERPWWPNKVPPIPKWPTHPGVWGEP